MPWFQFTIVTGNVDLLSDASIEAIDDYNDQFVDDPPLEPTLVRDGETRKAIFDLESSSFDSAVERAVTALKEALPGIEIVSVTSGRHPGIGIDIL